MYGGARRGGGAGGVKDPISFSPFFERKGAAIIGIGERIMVKIENCNGVLFFLRNS